LPPKARPGSGISDVDDNPEIAQTARELTDGLRQEVEYASALCRQTGSQKRCCLLFQKLWQALSRFLGQYLRLLGNAGLQQQLRQAMRERSRQLFAIGDFGAASW